MVQQLEHYYCHYMVTVQLSDIKSLAFKRAEDGKTEFAKEAKFFVESRILQRDVKIILEGVANQANGILLGTILHPVGFYYFYSKVSVFYMFILI